MAETPQEQPPEVVQKVAAQASFDALLIESLRDIRDSVGRVEDKTDHTNRRMDTLIDTTNHRLDDFRLSMDAHQREVRVAIGGKADKEDLPQLVAARLLNNKIIKWAIGGIFGAVAGTAAVQHWWGDITSLFGF